MNNNKLTVDRNGIKYYLTASEGIEILNVPVLAQTSLRYNPEEIWGRDGFVIDTDGAYVSDTVSLELRCEGNAARRTVLRALKCDGVMTAFQIETDRYFRLGKVSSHMMEVVNPRDSYHRVEIEMQPFYYVTKTQGERVEGDLPALPKLYLRGSGKAVIATGETKTELNISTGGLVVDSLTRSITDLQGRPAAREAFKGMVADSYHHTKDPGDVQFTGGLVNSETISVRKPRRYVGSVGSNRSTNQYGEPIGYVSVEFLPGPDGEPAISEEHWIYPTTRKNELKRGKGPVKKYTGNREIKQRRAFKGSTLTPWRFPEVPVGSGSISVSGASISQAYIYERYLLPPDVFDYMR